ncbi:helix-turn-helix transcriptional regulator [Rhodovulum steppense]|uniref:AlpA family transcriptional regulator n=1 Tax=Rhodovulum steppense TaxID=540251 RepID=A0A4R1YLM3_9RHOB|nr:helix-turn-helix domain-containing protein [Rhodovulum steppense]TCM78329.1 AlpA family transcriptional regulator [Rhodovulum steppense]
MPAEPIFVDTQEAARRLGLSLSTLEKYRFYRAADAPPYVRIGRAVRYRVSDLEAWAAAREAEQ